MILTWRSPDSSTRTLWQSYHQSHLVVKLEDLTEEMTNVALRISLFILKRVLWHTVKYYDMRRWIYFPSKERRAADLYRPQLGLNPRTLCSMTGTLSITPPRTTINCLSILIDFFLKHILFLSKLSKLFLFYFLYQLWYNQRYTFWNW
jgi:hypothetical protein